MIMSDFNGRPKLPVRRGQWALARRRPPDLYVMYHTLLGWLII